MKLSNQPCPDCKEDTLHRSMVCSRCGHRNLTPTQHREIGYTKIARGRRFKVMTGRAHIVHEQVRIINDAQVAPVDMPTAPVGTGGPFGKGRERFKA